MFFGSNDSLSTISHSTEDDCNSSDRSDDDFSSDEEIGDQRFGTNIAEALIVWALKFGISHNALTALLKILRRFGHEDEVPKEAKTLLNTPRVKIPVRDCPPGNSFYFGIEQNLISLDDRYFESSSEVILDIGIDGMSTSDSSNWELWPVMGSIVGHRQLPPFIIQAYAGPTKPADVCDYLREFSEELNNLKTNGVLTGPSGILKNFVIRCFICDSPAAAYITGRKGHSSKNGCPKCVQICGRDGRRLLYQYTSAALRTDESFTNRDDIDHHRPEFIGRHSNLENAGVCMVSQFPIEPMHLIDEGVTRDIVEAIVGNECPSSHMSNIALQRMHQRFLSFREYTPSEFERKPRTLNQVAKFKANEFRQMLFYTLPVLLKDFVSPQLYRQTLRLHVAVRLLQDENNFLANIPAARELINLFVLEFAPTYGIRRFKFNEHCLLHIPDCVEKYGPLYSFSAYKFENHFRILRNLLRKQNLHLQQLYNRFGEISNAKDLLENAVGSEGFEYNNFKLKPKSWRDGLCFAKPGVPLLITEFDHINSTIRGRRFLICENFYDDPVASMDCLGIILASHLSAVEEIFPVDSILYKFYCLPYGNKYVLTPMIHTS